MLGIISESEAKIQKIEKIKPKTNEVQEEEKIVNVDNNDKNGGTKCFRRRESYIAFR